MHIQDLKSHFTLLDYARMYRDPGIMLGDIDKHFKCLKGYRGIFKINKWNISDIGIYGFLNFVDSFSLMDILSTEFMFMGYWDPGWNCIA